MDEKKIARINELAHKAKAEGLTAEETAVLDAAVKSSPGMVEGELLDAVGIGLYTLRRL